MANSKPPSRLLAKSCEDPEHPRGVTTLSGHTASVLAAANDLVDLRAGASLRAVGLSTFLIDRLAQIVLLSALIHDLGKASGHFQAMIRRQGDGQLIRHEAVSAWLAWQEPLRTWLAAALPDPGDFPLVLAAIAGHHRKFEAGAVANTDAGLGTVMPIWAGHEDVAEMLQLGASKLNLSAVPVLTHYQLALPLGGSRALFMPLRRSLDERLGQDPIASKLLVLAKVLLLDADVAGSALPRVNNSGDWIRHSLMDRAAPEKILEVVSKRLGHLPDESNERGRFQHRVAASAAPITLVTAGCGSGKTVSAYLWAARQHAGRQLWITYPTTGTATEGFRDYLYGIDDLATALEHGRKAIDLDLLGLHEQSDDEAVRRDEERLASLHAWGRHAIACTVDTVLGLVQNQRKGLYAWAGLADGAVVFDEIHAYDDRLFGCLLRFLDALPGIPTLLMTASLPETRRKALDRLCQERHGIAMPVIDGPHDLESLSRYRLVCGQAPWPLVDSTMRAGGKVLWVANTVDRCLAAADLAANATWAPLVYHSRFRYMDRVNRHQDVVAAFKHDQGCFAVTTQVAEMSLDLSADLLVTEIAPVPALIQRMGRLNRRSSPEDPQPVKVAFIVEPPSHLPYEASELDDARKWLDILGTGDLSQRHLVSAWSQAAGTAETIASSWLDGGFDTEPRSVREGSPGITVLMDEDADAVRRDPAQAAAHTLPMPSPRGTGWLKWPRVAYYPVAPAGSILYDPNRGARWVK